MDSHRPNSDSNSGSGSAASPTNGSGNSESIEPDAYDEVVVPTSVAQANLDSSLFLPILRRIIRAATSPSTTEDEDTLRSLLTHLSSLLYCFADEDLLLFRKYVSQILNCMFVVRKLDPKGVGIAVPLEQVIVSQALVNVSTTTTTTTESHDQKMFSTRNRAFLTFHKMMFGVWIRWWGLGLGERAEEVIRKVVRLWEEGGGGIYRHISDDVDSKGPGLPFEWNEMVGEWKKVNWLSDVVFLFGCLVDLSLRLFRHAPRLNRDRCLRSELERIACDVDGGTVLCPFGRKERMIRLLPQEAKCFSTRARVNLFIVYEVLLMEKARQREEEGEEQKEEMADEEEEGEIVVRSPSRPPNILVRDVLDDSFSSTPEEQLTIVDIPTLEEEAKTSMLRSRKRLSYYDLESDFVIIENFSSDDILESELDDLVDERKRMLDRTFGESWLERVERVRKQSPFGHLPNWSLRSFIVKSNDDLRQEHLTMQLIRLLKTMWIDENELSVTLIPYRFAITGHRSGLVETIPDVLSLDGLMKKVQGYTSLLNFFVGVFGPPSGQGFIDAQRNFIESMAANSVMCYILHLKDRHNGNILLSRSGHIIHIDFGFLLGNSPGSMNFESAPFKLTTEFVQLIGGRVDDPQQSETFAYFRELVFQCLRVAVAESHRIVNLVETVIPMALSYPCFEGQDIGSTIAALKNRLRVGQPKDEDTVRLTANRIIDDSMFSKRTTSYDYFQWVTNGIQYRA